MIASSDDEFEFRQVFYGLVILESLRNAHTDPWASNLFFTAIQNRSVVIWFLVLTVFLLEGSGRNVNSPVLTSSARHHWKNSSWRSINTRRWQFFLLAPQREGILPSLEEFKKYWISPFSPLFLILLHFRLFDHHGSMETLSWFIHACRDRLYHFSKEEKPKQNVWGGHRKRERRREGWKQQRQGEENKCKSSTDGF